MVFNQPYSHTWFLCNRLRLHSRHHQCALLEHLVGVVTELGRAAKEALGIVEFTPLFVGIMKQWLSFLHFMLCFVIVTLNQLLYPLSWILVMLL